MPSLLCARHPASMTLNSVLYLNPHLSNHQPRPASHFDITPRDDCDAESSWEPPVTRALRNSSSTSTSAQHLVCYRHTINIYRMKSVSTCLCAQPLSRVQLFVTPGLYPQGSSIHGSFQARILEYVAIFFPQGIFLTQRSNWCLLHW